MGVAGIHFLGDSLKFGSINQLGEQLTKDFKLKYIPGFYY